MKKTLSLVLTLVLALCMFTMPAMAEAKEEVTIYYYYYNSVGQQEYTDQVEVLLNEILDGIEGYEHINMELRPAASGQHQTNLTLAQASGEQIDLISTYSLDFTTECENGTILPLEELIEKYPNVKSEVPEWLVEMGKINGIQYYFPTYQQATNGYYFEAPTAYLEAAGLTEETIRDTLYNGTNRDVLDMIEQYCLDVRAALDTETKWISVPTSYQLDWVEYIDNNYGQLMLREGMGGPEYYDLTEDGKMRFEYAAKWYEAGLIHPDTATITYNDFAADNYMNDESFIMGWPQNTTSEENVIKVTSYAEEIPISVIFAFDHWYIGSKWAAGGNAIYAGSEHPDEAMMIIELLMTKKGEQFYNTLVWGIEGTHYEFVESATDATRIKTLEYDGSQGGATSTYHALKWNVGNTFNAWLNQAMADGFNEYLLDNVHNAATTTTSAFMGGSWDLSSIEDERGQCKAITDEYHNALSQGIYKADWEAKYEEYVAKLEASGVQKILDVCTEQYNAHVGA